LQELATFLARVRVGDRRGGGGVRSGRQCAVSWARCGLGDMIPESGGWRLEN
jgi:hypothetical protein